MHLNHHLKPFHHSNLRKNAVLQNQSLVPKCWGLLHRPFHLFQVGKSCDGRRGGEQSGSDKSRRTVLSSDASIPNTKIRHLWQENFRTMSHEHRPKNPQQTISKPHSTVYIKYWTSQAVLVQKHLTMQKTWDAGSIPGSGKSLGRPHGNPPQYPFLESPMDREAWRATLRAIAKSWTRLKRLNMHIKYYTSWPSGI